MAAARNQSQHADRTELQRQSAQVSLDDGRTWSKSRHRLLDEGRGVGYHSLTRMDESHVGIVYEGTQSHLMFEKFSLDELLRR